ncbi:alginate export family protein [Candidatus Riflebacteria bacterium]
MNLNNYFLLYLCKNKKVIKMKNIFSFAICISLLPMYFVEAKESALKRIWLDKGNVKIKRIYRGTTLIYEQAWDKKTGKPVKLPPGQKAIQILQAPLPVSISSEPGEKNLEAEIKRLDRQNSYLKDQLTALEDSVDSLTTALEHQQMSQPVVHPAELEVSEEDIYENEPTYHWSGSIRDRFETKYYESKNGKKFASNQEFIGQRARIALHGKITPESSITLRFQDRRSWGENGQLSDNGDNTELNLAYFDYRDIFPRSNLRVGRQELAIADQRVVGSVGWSNQGRTFDSFLVSRDLARGNQLDFFFAKVVEDGNEASNDTDLGGIYARFLDRSNVNYHLYTLMKRDGSNDTDLQHFGVHLTGNSGKDSEFDWQLQGNMQTGQVGSSNISANSLHLKLGYLFEGSNKARLEGEYNMGSGDSNPAAGDIKTYDQLYPTNHNKYGIVDLFGFRNIQELIGAISLRPCKNSEIKLAYHQFSLTEKNDALYSVGGTAYTPDTGSVAGTNGSDIGTEVDLTYNYKYSPNLDFFFGGGVFNGDRLVENQYSLLDDVQFYYAGTDFKF